MSYLHLVRQALEIEAKAIQNSIANLDEAEINKMVDLFNWLSKTGGSLVTTGVGKSGIIANKIAATFSSLGLPSFYLHPVEAMHGDLGRMSKSDVLILISKSGATEELVKLLPYLSIPQERIVGLIGNRQSLLWKKSGVRFDCSIEKEACLNDLAPTTSTTTTLAIGDSLAVLYESVKGISKEAFAINHPGGLLGKSLLLKVREVMVPRESCPILNTSSSLQEAILKMTKQPVGLCVIEDQGEVKGLLVEGDIRRAFAKDSQALTKSVSVFMNHHPVTIQADVLVLKALEMMEDAQKPVKLIPVMENQRFVGVIRMQDLIGIGFSPTAKSNS